MKAEVNQDQEEGNTKKITRKKIKRTKTNPIPSPKEFLKRTT